MLFQVLCGFEPIFYTTHPNEDPKKMLDFQTIAVDFDGTLCYSKWPELDQPNLALIEYLQE